MNEFSCWIHSTETKNLYYKKSIILNKEQMCDLMSSNQLSTSNHILAQNITNSQAISGNGLNSSNSIYLLENARCAKLTADYKQIILELSWSFYLFFSDF